MGKNLGYIHAAIPGTLLAGGGTYAAVKKRDDETQRAYEARRRGLAVAAAVGGGVAGGQFIPPMLVKRAARSWISDYFAGERAVADAETARAHQEAEKALSPEERARIEAEAKERKQRRAEGFMPGGLVGRGIGTTFGAALMAKNIPQLSAAKGSQMLYHGTGHNALQGILSDDEARSGLRMEFAGTKGRLNASLMPNSIVRDLLMSEFGGDLSADQLVAASNRIEQGLKANASVGRPVLDVISDELDQLKGEFGLSDAQLKDLKARAETGLSQAGRRTYFANSPNKVHTWADDKKEGEKIVDAIERAVEGGDFSAGDITDAAAMRRKMLGVTADLGIELATGGLRGELRDMKQAHDYLSTLDVHPERVSPEFLRNLAREKGDTASFVLGARVPTSDVQTLADFKGVRTLLQFSPGLQGILGRIPGFEGYNPNNDISTAKNLARQNIKHVDVMDKDTKRVTRYMLDSFDPTSISLGSRLKSMAGAAMPLAATVAGADAIYRGVSGRRGILGTAMQAYKDRTSNQPAQEKRAGKYSPYINTAKNTLMYGVPILGTGALIGAGMDRIGREIVPVTQAEYDPISARDHVEGTAREAARGIAGLGLKAGTAAVLGVPGALLGRKLFNKYLDTHMAELIDAGRRDAKVHARVAGAKLIGNRLAGTVGAVLPMYAASAAEPVIAKYREAARGQDDLRTELGTTPEEQMETPWRSTILPAAAVLGGTGFAAGQIRRFFPGMLAKVKRGIALEAGPMVAPRSYTEAVESMASEASKGRRLDMKAVEALRPLERMESTVPEASELHPRIAKALDTIYENIPDDAESFNADRYIRRKYGEQAEGALTQDAIIREAGGNMTELLGRGLDPQAEYGAAAKRILEREGIPTRALSGFHIDPDGEAMPYRYSSLLD